MRPSKKPTRFTQDHLPLITASTLLVRQPLENKTLQKACLLTRITCPQVLATASAVRQLLVGTPPSLLGAKAPTFLLVPTIL